MYKWLICILISAPVIGATSAKDEAKASLKALVSPILQKYIKSNKEIKGEFTLEKCDKHVINWGNVLLMRESATLKYKFKPGCDIQGDITPFLVRPFPVELKLKNLHDFTQLKSQNTITATIESNPIMNLEVRGAELTGSKGIVKFEADYAVRIDPMKKQNMVSENLGGEIRISEIYGKKVSIKEKVKFE